MQQKSRWPHWCADAGNLHASAARVSDRSTCRAAVQVLPWSHSPSHVAATVEAWGGDCCGAGRTGPDGPNGSGAAGPSPCSTCAAGAAGAAGADGSNGPSPDGDGGADGSASSADRGSDWRGRALSMAVSMVLASFLFSSEILWNHQASTQSCLPLPVRLRELERHGCGCPVAGDALNQCSISIGFHSRHTATHSSFFCES